MATHKFEKGNRVRLLGGSYRGQSDPGRFTIIRQMPADMQGPLYRIKSDDESHERVAPEKYLQAIH
jgi:hypothetical protein